MNARIRTTNFDAIATSAPLDAGRFSMKGGPLNPPLTGQVRGAFDAEIRKPLFGSVDEV